MPAMRLPSLLRLGLLALLWGSNFLLIVYALEGFTPLQIMAGRLLLGAVVLLVFLLMRGQRLPAGASVWGHLLFAAVIGNVVPYYLFAWAEQTVPSGLAGVLNATTPLFTLVIAVGAGQEARITIDRVVGLVVGFVGVVVILAPWQAGALGSLAGQFGVLLAAACYGVVFVYQRRFLTGRGTPPLVLAAGQMIAAIVVVTLAAPVIVAAPVVWAARPLVGLLLLGTLGTAVAYGINFRLIQDEGATNTATVLYLLPVVSVGLGAAFLAEPVTINVVIGTVVVFVGIALTQQRLRLPGSRALPARRLPTAASPAEGGPGGVGAQPDETGSQQDDHQPVEGVVERGAGTAGQRDRDHAQQHAAERHGVPTDGGGPRPRLAGEDGVRGDREPDPAQRFDDRGGQDHRLGQHDRT
jgi:drug/metabolite transporter (DMT)-like permease